jgi:hypothetical protein
LPPRLIFSDDRKKLPEKNFSDIFFLNENFIFSLSENEVNTFFENKNKKEDYL